MLLARYPGGPASDPTSAWRGCIRFQPSPSRRALSVSPRRFEELHAQTLDELEGVVEQSSPVVERTRYNTAAAEEKVLVVVVGTGFKRCR